jgi:hypothetical protein
VMYGTPVVSTRIAIRGLGRERRKHVRVEKDAARVARAITTLLEDDRLWQRISHEGRTHATASHGLDVARRRLARVLRKVARQQAKSGANSSPAPAGHSPMNRQEYGKLIARVRDVVRDTLSKDATIIVVSKGDDDLLKLEGRRAWHFMQTEDGRYRGSHPAGSDEAIAELEKLRSRGGEYFLLPSTASWWLEYYDDFKRHLDARYELVVNREGTCAIYRLRQTSLEVTDRTDDAVGRPHAHVVGVSGGFDTRLIAFFLPQFHRWQAPARAPFPAVAPVRVRCSILPLLGE